MAQEIRAPQSEQEIKAAYALVKALAVHENSLPYLKISEAAFIAAATGDSPDVHILVAADASLGVIGVATYVTRFHIWNGTRIFELDDLYVSPKARGKGIGTKLLTALAAIAKQQNTAIKWQVNLNNEGAINLYKRLGANFSQTGVCFWRPENMTNE
jgi:ribosomal protein S18 acetylase RimI-like enzyme